MPQNFLLSVYGTCVTYNMSLIGNCLGCRDDLENALSDYLNGKFNINIDSVYTGEQLVDFFRKSFLAERIGKVVYRYED